MSPDPEDAPTGSPEALVGGLVPERIARDLLLPIWPVVRWHSAMPAAAMPEAAVNEYCQTLTAEDEIGVAGKRLVATPAGDAGGSEDGGQL